MFEREFYFYNSLCKLFQTVIEDQNQSVEDILNFLPIPLTLPGKMSLSRGVKEPLVFENLSTSGFRMWKGERIIRNYKNKNSAQLSLCLAWLNWSIYIDLV